MAQSPTIAASRLFIPVHNPAGGLLFPIRGIDPGGGVRRFLRPNSSAVAVRAADLRQVPQIDRVLESGRGRSR